MSAFQTHILTTRNLGLNLFFKLRLYWSLIKDLQTGLLVLTAVCGYFTACCTNPNAASLAALIGSLFLAVSGCTVLNMLYDRDIDARMSRTAWRPLPSGQVSPNEAFVIGLFLTLAGLVWAFLLDFNYGWVVSAGLLFDGVLYTLWLKRRTPFSILLGGLAGGMPALAGRTLAGGQIDPIGLLLAFGILAWIPTHIMTFTIRYQADYQSAGIPTFPAWLGVDLTRHLIAASSALTALIMVVIAQMLHLPAFYRVSIAGAGLLLISLVIASLAWKHSKLLNFMLYKGASIYMVAAMLFFILGGF
jgi:protoheme IX farnesyltransferase